jgi:hypothetical protein
MTFQACRGLTCRLLPLLPVTHFRPAAMLIMSIDMEHSVTTDDKVLPAMHIVLPVALVALNMLKLDERDPRFILVLDEAAKLVEHGLVPSKVWEVLPLLIQILCV